MSWAASPEVLWWLIIEPVPALDEMTTFTLFCCLHLNLCPAFPLTVANLINTPL